MGNVFVFRHAPIRHGPVDWGGHLVWLVGTETAVGFRTPSFEVEAIYRRPTRVEAAGPHGGRPALRDHVMLARIVALALLLIVTYERRLR